MKTWHILGVVGVLILGALAAAGLVTTDREAPDCKCGTACKCDPCQCPPGEGAAAACAGENCTCADCGTANCNCTVSKCTNCTHAKCSGNDGKCAAKPERGCCGL